MAAVDFGFRFEINLAIDLGRKPWLLNSSSSRMPLRPCREGVKHFAFC